MRRVITKEREVAARVLWSAAPTLFLRQLFVRFRVHRLIVEVQALVLLAALRADACSGGNQLVAAEQGHNPCLRRQGDTWHHACGCIAVAFSSVLPLFWMAWKPQTLTLMATQAN